MSMWKKTKLMLGLAADEDYDDGFDDVDHDRQPREGIERVRTARPQSQSTSERSAQPATRPSNSRQQAPAPRPRAAAPRAPQRSVVRPIPAATTVKPFVVSPDSFNDAQDIGDKYRGKQPVIINLQDLDRDLSRRLIDFASGLCYGLGGRMEKVADHVYMLTPSDVEVSLEERQRLRDRGLHDE